MDPRQAASIALDLIAQVSSKCDDQSIATIVACRQFLHAIRTGKLVVGAPTPEQPPEIPEKPA
jgi:CHASE2 domain-containing sensor protein